MVFESVHNMFNQLTRYTRQENWVMIVHKRPVIFLEKWADILEDGH